jgi:hypothetical protein
MNKLQVGILIDGSMDKADIFNADLVSFAIKHGYDPGEDITKIFENIDNLDSTDSEVLNEIADEAVDWLNIHAERPEYTYFTVEDNSLYLVPDLETAREDVEFISSREQEEPPDDYLGLWLHVNDHGNATLYFRDSRGTDREEWSVV